MARQNVVTARKARTNSSSGGKRRKKGAVKAMKAQSSVKIEQLILDHRENGRKLARSILRKWRARMSAEEIDSIVDLTLCEAARRFNPEHGASFMTFFFYHLRGYLVRAVASAVNANNVILAHLPHRADNNARNSENSESVVFVPHCASFGSFDEDGPEHLLLRKENIEICRDAVSKLDELEQEVIRRSFRSDEPLVSIAKSLGYSRCHISRVKKRAIEQLHGLLGSSSELAENSGLCERLSGATRKTGKRRSRRGFSRRMAEARNEEARHQRAS